MTDNMTIGRHLVELIRQGAGLEAVNTYYADDVVSVEATDGGPGPRVVRGIEAVRAKNRRYGEMMEIHDAATSGPFPHGADRFALTFEWDATHRESGQRQTLEEVGVYTVDDGKIVREEFFYAD